MTTREFEVLLAAARTVPDATRILQLVKERVDWKAFWALATHHNLRPLAYRSIESICWSEVPEPDRREWRNEVHIIAGRNLFLLGELIGIMQALEDAGIQAWVLKGMVYGEALYGDISLRETNDLDLLVDEQDLTSAACVIRHLGYLPRSGADVVQMAQLFKYVGEYTFEGKLVDIDLHWRLSNIPLALAPRLSDLPRSPQRMWLAGSSVRTIATEDLPLYLVTQGGTDAWHDLRRVADLAEYIRRFPGSDWRATFDAVRKYRADGVLQVGLQLTSRLFGAAISPELQHEFEDAGIRNVAAGIERRMSRGKKSVSLQSHLFQIRWKRGIGEKVKLLWSILTHRMTADAQWITLPRSLWWLYRGLRPIRIFLQLSKDV